jgi:pyruvate-ferredoxin/flavodoxin oxidoreductase
MNWEKHWLKRPFLPHKKSEEEITLQRERVEQIRTKLSKIKGDDAKLLEGVLNYLIDKSIWAIGGDGWAYDIGYGGLDHVMASGANINILVLDTGVYSNTGGQTSKATPVGAVAKFSAQGKKIVQKDLALHALDYDHVYVARVAMGANNKQTLHAFLEAEAYDGPSIIIAYSQCIAHGYDLRYGMEHQRMAVESGLWPLFRYNPMLKEEGKNPFMVDYKEPKLPVKEYMYSETRFNMVQKMDPKLAEEYLQEADAFAKREWIRYQDLLNSQNLSIEKDQICKI